MVPENGLSDSRGGTVGVVYLAFGAPYLSMAMVSAASLRATNPDVAICMLTNVTRAAPLVPWWESQGRDQWIFIEDGAAANREYKTDLFRLSPFEKSLYLDCDTLVVGELDRIWYFLDFFDVLLRPVPRRGADRDLRILPRALPFGDVTHFNAGVFGFRRTPAVAQLFELWNARFRAMKMHVDQPALVEALFASQVRLFPLRMEFNEEEVWKLSVGERKRVVIWHYKCRSPDRATRALIRAAVTWFGGNERDHEEVEAFLTNRRHQEGVNVRARLSSIARELRGSVTHYPSRFVGAERWREMTAQIRG